MKRDRTLLAAVILPVFTLLGCSSDPKQEKSASTHERLLDSCGCDDTGWCGFDWQDPSYDGFVTECDDGWGGSSGGTGGTGCSQSQIDSLVAACHQICDSPPRCGDPGVVQQCASCSGIQYCRINPDGSLDAPCAFTYQTCS